MTEKMIKDIILENQFHLKEIVYSPTGKERGDERKISSHKSDLLQFLKICDEEGNVSHIGGKVIGLTFFNPRGGRFGPETKTISFKKYQELGRPEVLIKETRYLSSEEKSRYIDE